MIYLWTEDKGAGLHFWELVNKYLYAGELVVESKGLFTVMGNTWKRRSG